MSYRLTVAACCLVVLHHRRPGTDKLDKQIASGIPLPTALHPFSSEPELVCRETAMQRDS